MKKRTMENCHANNAIKREDNKSKGGFDNYGDDVKRTTAYLEVSNPESKPKVDYKNILNSV